MHFLSTEDKATFVYLEGVVPRLLHYHLFEEKSESRIILHLRQKSVEILPIGFTCDSLDLVVLTM